MSEEDDELAEKNASVSSKKVIASAIPSNDTNNEAIGNNKQAEIDFAHLRGLQDYYKHKTYWSWFLMGLLTTIVLFQSFLLIRVGGGIWDFSSYRWLLPALLVQNVLQIFGLAFVVVKSLYN